MSGPIDLNSDDARERLTRLFRHAQVGRSVSSVTHDLNNYLGAIMAYAELAGMDKGISADTARMLGEGRDGPDVGRLDAHQLADLRGRAPGAGHRQGHGLGALGEEGV